MIPKKNIGLFISANSSNFQNSKSRVFINQFINDLLARLVPDRITEKEKVTLTAGSVDEPLEAFTGTYRYTSYGYKTLDKLGVLFGLAPELEIGVKDNTLEILDISEQADPYIERSY